MSASEQNPPIPGNNPAPNRPIGPSETTIEPESNVLESGRDSVFEDDNASDTTSLRSSLLDYQYENGRRYVGFGKETYFIPTDEKENDRLDLAAHMLNLVMGGDLHKAPVGDSPQRILDLATGTGLWAIDMADKYPSAEVIGNDLSPAQPSFVPPNVRFEVDDIEQDWLFSEKFDLIHMRMMGGSLRDWPRFTKPGGWVEFMDFTMAFYTNSGHFKPGCAVDKWCNEVKATLADMGLEAEPGPRLFERVTNAGFTNVQQQLFSLPVGTWPKDQKLKEIGMVNRAQILDGLEGFTLRPLTMRGWSPEEIQVFMVDIRRELKNLKMQMQTDGYIVWAQKPLDA